MRNPWCAARTNEPIDRTLELAVLGAFAAVMLLLSIFSMRRQAYTA